MKKGGSQGHERSEVALPLDFGRDTDVTGAAWDPGGAAAGESRVAPSPKVRISTVSSQS